MTDKELITKHINDIDNEIKQVRSATLKAELLKAKSQALIALRIK